MGEREEEGERRGGRGEESRWEYGGMYGYTEGLEKCTLPSLARRLEGGMEWNGGRNAGMK